MPRGASNHGIKRHVALGYTVTTDVFELQMPGLDDAAFALGCAVGEALARRIGVDADEVGFARAARSAAMLRAQGSS